MTTSRGPEGSVARSGFPEFPIGSEVLQNIDLRPTLASQGWLLFARLPGGRTLVCAVRRQTTALCNTRDSRKKPVLNSTIQIRLALEQDAPRIAAMSRDLIERGLGWSWTPQRVFRSIRDRNTNVAVAGDAKHLVGFGIMKYRDEEAHLHLFAVQASHRRQGIGTALMAWFERTALVAGIGVIHLEARLANHEARAFYHRLGYKEITTVRGYYLGKETAVRLAKDLWA